MSPSPHRPRGLPTVPEALDSDANGSGGQPSTAVQFIAYDPSGVGGAADIERGWRVKNLSDYLSAGGGGSKAVRVPFTLADLHTPANYPITAVSDGGSTFTIAGDHTADFPAGSQFEVNGSSGNDSNYTAAIDATFGAGHTTITTVDPPTDPTADGHISAISAAATGFLIYQPAQAGEVLPYYAGVAIRITEAFDGSNPHVHLGVAGANQALTSGDASVADALLGSSDAATAQIGANSPTIVLGLDPVLLFFDDNAGGDPGSTVGAGEVVLFVLTA